MKFRHKINLTLVIAAIIAAVFLYFNRNSNDLIESYTDLLEQMGKLQTLEARIDEEVLRATNSLTDNSDEVQSALTALRGQIQSLQAHPFLHQPEQAFVQNSLAQYQSLLNKKQVLIDTFYTHQQIISRLLTHLRELSRSEDSKAADLAHETFETLLWAYLHRDNEVIKELLARRISGENGRDCPELHEFSANFTVYIDILKHIAQLHTAPITDSIKNHFIITTKYNVRKLGWVSWMLSSAFAVAVGFIIFFLFHMERENQKLLQLQNDLKNGARLDRLTGLGNRLRFEEERQQFNQPAVLLINIDHFKHVNAFYGIPVGDYVLQTLARLIQANLPLSWQKYVYRTGADDFVILFEADELSNPEGMATLLLQAIEQYPFRYQEYDINISVSIAMSRVEPLLETADMAYKFIETRRIRFLEYQDELGIYQRIEHNLNTWRMLKDALERDALIPYFQPIVNNRNGKIEKYECLARIIDRQGTVLSPGAFMDVAKQSGLYAEITMRMIDKSFAAFRQQPYEFSINLAPEDIIDRQVRRFIRQQLQASPEVAKRAIFEILENEHIEDYTAVRDFIQEVKQFGCQVAIDDFGAGYANLNHLVNLHVDYIKIDAALIKNLDTNLNSQILVQTIVEFSSKIHIKALTAEFVCSEEIQKMVTAMGVDYSQGYYVGMPKPDLI
jgi:diguanylate cyclase (GGDEF)-like protein